MTTLLLLDIRGLATADLWAFGIGALMLTAGLLVLQLQKRFVLLLLGHVAACAWGIAGARLLFVSQATGAAMALGLAVFFLPAA